LSPSVDRQVRIRCSALWAAYGDALGFITEGVDTAGVRRRTGAPRVEKTVPWKRRIGGKFGPTVELPAGCISDDTQLRLASSRSMRAHGTFDVETFAKIELTVWPGYALGAGKGSLEAAANLRHRDVTWATNFFSADRADYLNGGGNGAAMRVQPHVWAHGPGGDRRSLIAAVVTNAVATHGHLRGILGAVFHARCLLHAFERGAVPSPNDWDAIAAELPQVGGIAESDEVLAELWLGQWELHSGKRFADEVNLVVKEIEADLQRCREVNRAAGVGGYDDAVEALGGFPLEQRGSGTKTSILAAVAAWLFADSPLEAVIACANQLGTDTDTVATMAGAIVGAVTGEEPDGELADREYIVHEADRMWAISQGAGPPSFQYPSLVTWTPPRSASDCVEKSDSFDVAGLGPAEPGSEEFATSGRTPGIWQWLRLWFGQRMLMKRRTRPKALASSQRVGVTQQYLALTSPQEAGVLPPPTPSPPKSKGAAQTLPLDDGTGPISDSSLSLHDLTDRAIASRFDPTVIGETLLALSERSDGVEASIAYVSIITKARMSRRDRERREDR